MPIAYPYKMSDWYGYDKGCSSLTQFPLSARSNALGVCSLAKDQTKWHDGSGSIPVNGDTIWDNSNGTGVPQNGYYLITNTTYMQILSGIASNISTCGPP